MKRPRKNRLKFENHITKLFPYKVLFIEILIICNKSINAVNKI